MKVVSEKRLELSQPISSLIGSVRMEKDASVAIFGRGWRMKMTSEDITRSAAIITNNIVAIVPTRGANIQDTSGNPEDRKIGCN